MNFWFVKNKALFLAEELIALLREITLEIETNKQRKSFTDADVRTLSNEFFNAINQKISELKNDAKYRDPEFIEFFQLAIVAMIDDMFLTMSWDGRTFWSNYLLEMRFFSTRASGDIFFDNCRKILARHDDKFKELAAIYHLCLVAGFRGKYLHSEYDDEINAIKSDLYRFFNKDIDYSNDEVENLAMLPSGAAENKSKNALVKSNKIYNRLVLLNFLLIFGFFIASYFVWFHNENLIFRNL